MNLKKYVSGMSETVFKSQDLGLRIQKKILSRMASKNIAKTFIDGTTASLLDNLYRLCKLHVIVLFNLFEEIVIFHFDFLERKQSQGGESN